jgi:hypothetical protein
MSVAVEVPKAKEERKVVEMPLAIVSGIRPLKRVVLLNAFPLSAFPMNLFSVVFRRVTLSELSADCQGAEVVNYIRHPATVELLSKELGRKLEPSAGLYKFDEARDKAIYVITLKQPQRGAEVTTIKPEDLDIVRARVL